MPDMDSTVGAWIEELRANGPEAAMGDVRLRFIAPTFPVLGVRKQLLVFAGASLVATVDSAAELATATIRDLTTPPPEVSDEQLPNDA